MSQYFYLRHYLQLWCIFLLPFSNVLAESSVSEYTLGSGDVVKIEVYNEDDLNMEAQLSDAGTISYPLLGELNVRGLTVGALQSRIESALMGDYLLDPKVTVRIVKYRNFYVNGEVIRPGGFPYQPGLTVRKAISMAGGLTERASTRKIFVIPEQSESLKARRVDLNTKLSPGDILTIEQSFF